MIAISLCIIGGFYAFAGYVATRAALTSHLVDRAIAAIGGKRPDAEDTARTAWLLLAATIVFAGGMALLFLLASAKWLFIASAIGQALYLFVLAPRYFDVVDPPDPRGRRQTTNAFILYVAATAFVVWAAGAGYLKDWHDLGGLTAIPLAAVGAHIAYIAWALKGSVSKTEPSAFGTALSDQALAEGRDPSQSKRIKLMADYDCNPLWALDEDSYGDFSPEALGLSPQLTQDLNDWAEAYSASLNRDDPSVSLWTDEQFAAHAAMARPLAARLGRERPDLTIFILDGELGVVQVHADQDVQVHAGEENTVTDARDR